MPFSLGFLIGPDSFKVPRLRGWGGRLKAVDSPRLKFRQKPIHFRGGLVPSRCFCLGEKDSGRHVGIAGVALHKTRPISIIEDTNGCSFRLVWESYLCFRKQLI